MMRPPIEGGNREYSVDGRPEGAVLAQQEIDIQAPVGTVCRVHTSVKRVDRLADRHHRGAHQGADGTGRLVQLEPFRLPGYLDCYEVTGHARAVGERPSAHPASLRCELRTPESYKRRAGRNRHAA